MAPGELGVALGIGAFLLLLTHRWRVRYLMSTRLGMGIWEWKSHGRSRRRAEFDAWFATVLVGVLGAVVGFGLLG